VFDYLSHVSASVLFPTFIPYSFVRRWLDPLVRWYNVMGIAPTAVVLSSTPKWIGRELQPLIFNTDIVAAIIASDKIATTIMDDYEKYSQQYFEQRIHVLREEIATSIPTKDQIDRNGIFASTIQSYDLSKESLRASFNILQRLEKEQEDNKDVDPSLIEAAKEAVETTQNAVENLSKTATSIGSNVVTSSGLLHLLKANKDVQRSLFECTVLVQSTAKNLAEWCAKDPKQNHALLDVFLANADCMKGFLIAGGPVHGNFGPALCICENLYMQFKEGEVNRSISAARQSFLQRLALAVALEHASPVPVWRKENSEHVDPTERFWHYADAHFDGALDSAFDTLSVWDMRMVVDADATHQDLTWGREYLKAYRPDEIWTPDEHWRYVVAVKSDVGYRQPEHEFNNYKDLVSAGGKCGARAWFGRFICKAWGIPTWGIRQPGHAAVTKWTSDGWKICLGAPNWDISWWDEKRFIGDTKTTGATRRGPDFLEESAARKGAEKMCGGQSYEDVVLLECLAECLGETIENDFAPPKFWRSLALAKRKFMATSQTSMSSISIPYNGWSATTMGERLDQEGVAIEADGKIVIPSASFMKKPMGVSSMDSFLGGKQIHFLKNKDGMVEYELPSAIHRGTYVLSLKVVNIHRNQVPMEISVDHTNSSEAHDADDFEIVSATEPQELEIPYTEGGWQTTKEMVCVVVSPGSRLHLSRKAPCWGLTMKEIVLTPINQL
jgi:hypothetical protein